MSLQTISYRIPGHTTYEYRLAVPLRYPRSGGPYGKLTTAVPADGSGAPGETITIFAREIVRAGNETAPRLVYFQGGPGSAAPRPAPISGWVAQLAAQFRVVLLDERGTGQSHALDQHTVTAVGDAAQQADYLSYFRADSIVADAESLRQALQGDEPWYALGQSFGGFCLTTYLSQAPQGLRGAMITAGLPSLTRHADEVYRRTYQQTELRNQEFFTRYPRDEETCWQIVEHLASTPDELLPTGEALTPGRFRMLGINLGTSYGLEKIHQLLEDPFVTVGGRRRLSSRFRAALGSELSYWDVPMYFALHESIYAQASTGATNWSAHRMREEFPSMRLPELSADAERELRAAGYGFRFTGEHVYPWQGEQDPALQPLLPAVDALAQRGDLPNLHDPGVLAANEVPVAAWIYRPDMFVPAELSEETAAQIRGTVVLRSAQYHHDALRTNDDVVIPGLLSALGLAQ
ncbi:MAG: alpha/beta fold hydrolase [Trueperella sp.]|nr:alpha/beta fold hydrolase [Trueperella sp.]